MNSITLAIIEYSLGFTTALFVVFMWNRPRP